MISQADGAGVFGGVPVAHVARNVLASTAHGDVGTAHMEVVVANSRPEKFQAMIADMTKLENMDAVKYSTFLVFDFKADATTLSALYKAFVLLSCDIVGVSHHGQSQCSAVCRRTKPRAMCGA